jgi:hypothetical protein
MVVINIMNTGPGRISHPRGSGLIGSVVGAAGNLLNRAIDILPTELHIPGYQYCGPGTKLKERLARGDPGVNKLDSACKLHDIAYSKYSDIKNRSIADRELAERAWERVKASDASLSEKAAAWAVTNIMKAKSKFGGGKKKQHNKRKKSKCNCRNKKCSKVNKKKGKGLYLRPYKGSGVNKKKTSTQRKK